MPIFSPRELSVNFVKNLPTIGDVVSIFADVIGLNVLEVKTVGAALLGVEYNRLALVVFVSALEVVVLSKSIALTEANFFCSSPGLKRFVDIEISFMSVVVFTGLLLPILVNCGSALSENGVRDSVEAASGTLQVIPDVSTSNCIDGFVLALKSVNVTIFLKPDVAVVDFEIVVIGSSILLFSVVEIKVVQSELKVEPIGLFIPSGIFDRAPVVTKTITGFSEILTEVLALVVGLFAVDDPSLSEV